MSECIIISESEFSVRDSTITIRKGGVIKVSQEQLLKITQRLERFNTDNFIFHSIDLNDGFYMLGCASNALIEKELLVMGVISDIEVGLIKSIANTAGFSNTEAWIRTNQFKGEERIRLLEECLSDLKWKKGIAGLSEDIKTLDLSTMEGLLRAIQLQCGLDIRKQVIKSNEKYYGKYPDVLIAENEKAESQYQLHINSPLYVTNKHVAAAILTKNSDVLIRAFVGGRFDSCEKVFKMATGHNLTRLSNANKTKALLSWSGHAAA
jgi:hypothetical protein